MKPISIRIARLTLPFALALALGGCSLDVIPVNSAWLKAFQNSKQPVSMESNAPGRFKHLWAFEQNPAAIYDPTKIEVQNGVARLKKLNDGSPMLYPIGAQSIEFTEGVPYGGLSSFKEVTAGSTPPGKVRYQLSPNRAQWYWFDSKNWSLAGADASLSNGATEIHGRLSEYGAKFGQGLLFVRAFLTSDGKTGSELKSIEVQGVQRQIEGSP